MAYDHDGDLPEGYDIELVARLSAEPYQLSYSHQLAEQGNYMNIVGHKAIVRSSFKVYGPTDASLAQIGSMMYETFTDTHLVGGDFVNTPTYCGPDDQKIAENVALALIEFDGYDLETFSYAALQTMGEQAPRLDGLVDRVVRHMIGQDRVTLRRVKTGAALMRSLHITAAQRIDNEAFGATE